MSVTTAHGAQARGERQPSTVAFRIWEPIWREDDRFANLLDWLRTNHETIDEIALFDSFVHILGTETPRELDATRDLLADRLRRIRDVGIARVGINVLVTLGHGIHADVRESPLPHVVGHDGRVGMGYCWSSPELLAVVRTRYASVAAASPDFIWVDDDFRAVSHGVPYPCFCERCLAAFRGATLDPGADREALVAELNEPSNAELRREWSGFVAAQIDEVARTIREAVDGVDAAIPVGLMTIGYAHNTYAGYPIGRWSETLRSTMARPGHGFYTDDAPREFVRKVFEVARQDAAYPPAIVDVQYELENWSYVTLNKAVRTVTAECTAAIACGSTGVAFNAIYERARSFDEYEPLIARIREHRAVWETMAELRATTHLAGFRALWHPDLMARRTVGDEGWFTMPAGYDIERSLELAHYGLPLCVAEPGNCGTLLAGRVGEALDDDELEAILAGGVYLDTEALAMLWRRGLGELTGVRPGSEHTWCIEELREHPPNPGGAGESRRAWPSRGPHAVIEPVAADVEVVAGLMSEATGELFGASLTVYENELGGRVAVGGYAPWTSLGRAAKVRSLGALFDWLSRETVPVRVETVARVMPLVRTDATGRVRMIALLNLSLDPTPALTLTVRGGIREPRLWLADGEAGTDGQAGADGAADGQRLRPLALRDDERLDLPALPPWGHAVILGE